MTPSARPARPAPLQRSPAPLRAIKALLLLLRLRSGLEAPLLLLARRLRLRPDLAVLRVAEGLIPAQKERKLADWVDDWAQRLRRAHGVLRGQALLIHEQQYGSRSRAMRAREAVDEDRAAVSEGRIDKYE